MLKKLFCGMLAAMAAALLCARLDAQVITKCWVDTYTWSGNGMTTTQKFSVQGNEWRVVFSSKDKIKPHIYVTEVKTNKTTELTKRTPETRAFTSWAQPGYGDFILTIVGGPASWSLTVEQYMDRGEEWSYKRGVKNPPPREQIAAWTGDGSETFQHEALEGDETCLTFTLATDGIAKVLVKDGNGRKVYQGTLLKEGLPSEAWFYKPGIYTVEIESDVPWSAKAEVRVKQAAK